MSATGQTRTAGVIGWRPVKHSRSPRLHGHWLARYGIDGAFVPFQVHPDRVAAAVQGLRALGLVGAAVTVPHKLAVMPHLDRLTATAQRIGAVNTIIVEADDTLVGDNTDGGGFLDHLRQTVPAWQPEAGSPPRAGSSVVIGAGGAARAILVALADSGAGRIRLINRTPERAEALAADLGLAIEVVDWTDRQAALDGAGLIVNTTTQGMDGQAPLDLTLDAAPATAVVYDIVYSPLETPLLTAARLRGLTVVDGLGMLLHQGRAQFRAWFGVDPAVDDATRRAVLA